MLILTCKAGQCIRVGDSVAIRVLGKQRGQIKLGIDAPLEIPVHREEIYNRRMQVREKNDPFPDTKVSGDLPGMCKTLSVLTK